MLVFSPHIFASDFPCEVGLAAAVDNILEHKNYMNFTQFSLKYVEREANPLHANSLESRFGGYQTLEEREKSFFARNQTIHCGFVKGLPRLSSTGFQLSENDKAYMNTCRVAVSSCIFGSSDFLRRPTSRLVNEPFLIKSHCLPFMMHSCLEDVKMSIFISNVLCSTVN